jgi:hypothetical protein
MKGLTNYITEASWKDIIIFWFVQVDDGYKKLIAQRDSPLRKRGPEPKMSDSEVMTVSLVIETFFNGREEIGYAFVCQFLGDLFPNLLDLDRFNHRRRQLISVIEMIRRQFRQQLLDPAENVRLVDSAPVTLMTYTRGARCESVYGPEYFGVVTSKKGKFFGLRLHLTTTPDQLIDEWMLAPASVPDGKAVSALLEDCTDLAVIGDKAYNDEELENRLWRKRRIHLLPLRKSNQSKQWPDNVRRAMGRVRHRVETVFSVLTTVFNVQRPRGRSLAGHVVRVATCILAHTMSFLMAQNPIG